MRAIYDKAMKCPHCGGEDLTAELQVTVMRSYVTGLGFGDILTEMHDLYDMLDGAATYPVPMQCDDCGRDFDADLTEES